MTSNEALIDRDRQDLVTRQVLDESRLIRFVPAPDGSVAPDLARKLPPIPAVPIPEEKAPGPQEPSLKHQASQLRLPSASPP